MKPGNTNHLFESLEGRSLLSAFVVDFATDESDGNFGPGDLSLREAIELANATPGADEILFDAAMASSTFTLTLGALSLTEEVSVSGVDGSDNDLDIRISGNGDQVFQIASAVTATLSRLLITGGVGTSGGAIVNTGGTLALLSCRIIGNSSGAGGGGAIFNDGGTLSLDGCVVTSNATDGDGGAILSSGGSVTIAASTLAGNGAVGAGGAVRISAGSLTVSESALRNNGADSGGAISIASGANASITGGNINLNVARLGGGILSAGTLTITRGLLTENSASDTGGGIQNQGTLTVSLTTISDNVSVHGGGALYNLASATIDQSTLSGNTTDTGNGGAIRNQATLTITSSTLSGNSATGGGGAITTIFGNVSIISSTITLNTADSDDNGSGAGGGVRVGSGTVTLTSTIVAGNLRGLVAGDIDGTVDAGSSNNLIGDAATAGGLTDGASGNIVGADAQLGALADNGGPTFTHAVLAGSEAIDAGSNGNAYFNDQRGAGYPRQRGAAVDIGAFEYDPDDFPDQGEWPIATNITIDPNTGDGGRAGELGNNSDTDLFKFMAAGDGTATVTLDVAINLDGVLNVYDAAHNFIATFNDLGSGGDEVGSFSVLANKVYFVLVSGFRLPGGGYILKVNGPSAPDDYADAGAWPSAAGIYINPNTGDGGKSGVIEATGDTDLFKFTAAGSGTAIVTLDVAINLDGWFEVYDGARNFILRENSKASGGDEAQSFAVTANQVYFVLVGGWRNPGGGYIIKADGPSAPDDHADAGDWANAANISINSNGDGGKSGMIEAANDTDLFRFTAQNTGTINVTLDVAINFDGWVEIYDASHNLIVRQNVKASGGDELVGFAGVAGEDYFILVGGWRNPGGGYNVLVNG